MDEVPVRTDPHDASARAEIDRCAGCGGLFLEFFDGEPSAISRGLRGRADLAETRREPAPDRRVCPDCDAPMIRRAYLGQGPELARCDTCMAVFLTPAEAASLAQLVLEPEAPREEPSWLERLLRWLPRA